VFGHWADLDQLDRFERLDEVPRSQVVCLAGGDDLFAAVEVCDTERACEQLAPVIALTAVIGQARER
jgi:hypothetical protein